jgi:hypothetical protein
LIVERIAPNIFVEREARYPTLILIASSLLFADARCGVFLANGLMISGGGPARAGDLSRHPNGFVL